jgi:hypothetical protein
MGLVPYQAPATLDQVKRLVLDAVSSPSTRVMYGKALTHFFRWRAEQGSPPFSRAALESRGYAPSTHQPAPGRHQKISARGGRQRAARCRRGRRH